MAKTEEYLQEFVTGLQSVLEGKLLSAVLYGSAATGEAYSPESDLNVLVVLKEFSLSDISGLKNIIRRGWKHARIMPVFWTEGEFKNSLDVFPVEFLEMKRHHKVLYGADILAGLDVDTKNLRHQIEFELRGKLLRLRAEWPGFEDSPKAGMDVLARAGTSLTVIFSQAQGVPGSKLDASLAEPFRRCVLMKRGGIKLDRDELARLFCDVHDSVGRIIQVIDKI